MVLHSCPGCGATSISGDEGQEPLDRLTAALLGCDTPGAKMPDSLRQSILARDDYSCLHCGARGVELQVHHITLESKGGKHEPANLMSLCRLCHELVHEGYLIITGTAPHGLVFTDRMGRSVAPSASAGTSIPPHAAAEGSESGPRGPLSEDTKGPDVPADS
jgi:hypothetical protein